MSTENSRTDLINEIKKRALKPLSLILNEGSVKYIVDKDTGEVLVSTVRDDFPMDADAIAITDPPIAKGTDLSAPLVYKDGEIQNSTEADELASVVIYNQRKQDVALVNAQKFMEGTNDTGISATVLIEVLREQMLNLENSTPIDSFEDMMTSYDTRVDNWTEITQSIRFC